MMASLRRKRRLILERRAAVQTGVADMCCEFACRVFLEQHEGMCWIVASQNAVRQARQEPERPHAPWMEAMVS